MTKKILVLIMLSVLCFMLPACSTNEATYTDQSDNWTVTVKVVTSDSFREEEMELLYDNEDSPITELNISYRPLDGTSGDLNMDEADLQATNPQNRFTISSQGEATTPVYDDYEVEIRWKNSSGEEFIENLNPALE